MEFRSFNTDDGIWRATMAVTSFLEGIVDGVSIPMTVFGGLQFLDIAVEFFFIGVSIPMTVFGGLQLPRWNRCIH